MNIWDSDLLNELTDRCVLLNKGWKGDGYGGQITTWTEGAEFDAIITPNNSEEVVIAGAATGLTIYGVKTKRDVELEYHTVFRVKKDGTILRVTDRDGNKTPDSSDIDARLCNAEVYTLPTE